VRSAEKSDIFLGDLTEDGVIESRQRERERENERKSERERRQRNYSKEAT
jgi:hypothetical protein